MTTIEVGKRLVELVRANQARQAIDELYHDDVVSIEAMGDNPESKGIDMCRNKGEWFDQAFEIHGVEVLGPYPNDDKFAVHIAYDVTNKESGKRFTMNEVGLYQVKNGKITWEKFYYDPALFS